MRALLVQALEPRGDGRRRPAQQVPRGPVGSARAHDPVRDGHDLRRHRRRRSRVRAGARGARAHPRRRSRHRTARTRATTPTCCCGSTRSRSSRSCSRTASTPGGCPNDDADRYVAEMARVAEMVELPPAHGAAIDGRGARVPAVGAADAAGHAGRVRRPARRPVPADAARSTDRCGSIPTTAAIAILPGYARRMYRLPWIPGAGLPVRAAMFPLSRALNLMTPTPPVVRAAYERVAA